jgi:hypothetical protein
MEIKISHSKTDKIHSWKPPVPEITGSHTHTHTHTHSKSVATKVGLWRGVKGATRRKQSSIFTPWELCPRAKSCLYT